MTQKDIEDANDKLLMEWRVRAGMSRPPLRLTLSEPVPEAAQWLILLGILIVSAVVALVIIWLAMMLAGVG